MKVMIATGGTGGHINPALDLADYIKKDNPENEVLFFGSNDRLEATIIPQRGYPFSGFAIKSTAGGLKNKVDSLLSMLKTRKACLDLLKDEKPDIVIGFGNYISIPLITAAHSLRIPIVLHEQNSYAGKANVFLARYANAIVGCYESNLDQFPKEKFYLYGNPSASVAKDTKINPQLLLDLDLDPNKPYVVVMLGSLGSSSVSKVIDDAIPLFSEEYQMIISIGKANEYTYKNKEKKGIRFVEYIDGKQALKGSSLAILRAGATTIAEVEAIGAASILIPSPYVPNNHQLFNAKALSDKGAAILLEEKDLDAKKLADLVNSLMLEDKQLEEIRTNARSLAKDQAAEDIVKLLKELCQHG